MSEDGETFASDGTGQGSVAIHFTLYRAKSQEPVGGRGHLCAVVSRELSRKEREILITYACWGKLSCEK